MSRRAVSDRDAACVARLRRLGALIVGKTAMDQLAWTMTGLAPGKPIYENPLLPGHLPGGSSGGSAAAVAAGIVRLGLGSDSAGSIRVPAAWCGVVGVKPTHGILSTVGVAPLANRFDTIGLIARSAAEVMEAFSAMTETPATAGQAGRPRLGVPRRVVESVVCDLEVAAMWVRAVPQLGDWASSVTELERRFDAPGIGTIFAAELAARWQDFAEQEPEELVEPSVREGIMRGSETPATKLVRAHDALDEVSRGACEVFDDVDLLALPAAPCGPPRLGQPAPVATLSAFTRAWSAYGWPALVIPVPDATEMASSLWDAGDDDRLLRWGVELEGILSRGG